jgi:SAM-dependent methyltransferase
VRARGRRDPYYGSSLDWVVIGLASVEAGVVLSDDDTAALYDQLYPWAGGRRPDETFYLDLAMAAEAVLDVGCGTGSMLHRAREAGHRGRLVGLDPDQARLRRARRRGDIEWVAGTAADAGWDQEFDLATMTGHAFQCLAEDEELHRSLVAIRTALRVGGRFAFETRHPQARAWREWNPTNATDITDPAGRSLRVEHQVESVTGDLVTFTETTRGPDGTILRTDQATLRFLDPPTLNTFLTDAGFIIDTQYGDWQHQPITNTSREIITIAHRP